MRTHTQGFKDQIKKMGREIDSIITYGDTVLSKEQLYAVTPSFQGSILKSVMKQLEINSSVLIPIGTILNYKFGVKVNGEYEYLNFGNYIVKSVEKQEDTRSYKITCYDKMLLSMKDYEKMPIVYPTTVREYINSICLFLGINFANKNDEFANYDKVIEADLYDGLGYTFRDVLDELAQVTASIICINENDELEVRYIQDAVTGQNNKIEWDGDTSGKEVMVFEELGMTLYKVSDKILNKEDLIGKTYIFSYSDGTNEEIEILEDDYGKATDGRQIISYGGYIPVIVIVSETTEEVPYSTGTYFFKLDAGADDYAYVSKFDVEIDRSVIEWDGETTDRETINYMGYFNLYKVSDQTLTHEQLIGGQISATNYVTEEVGYVEITSGSIEIIEDGNVLLIGQEGSVGALPIVIIINEPTTNFPQSAGVYFISFPDASGYTSSLSFLNITSEEIDEIDENFLRDINVNFGEKFGAINTIVLSRSADSDSVYYPEVLPEKPYEIKISDNQIMNGNNRADFLPDIYEKLNGLEFYTNDFVSTGICYLELGDRYNVKIGENVYSCVMLNDEVLITQGLQENVYTELPEQTETDYKHASKDDRTINQVYVIAKKNEGKIEEVVSSVDNTNKRINKVETSQTDTERKIEIITTNIDDNGNVTEVTTTTGFTFNANGMTIDDKSGFKAEHTANGTYYKDGNAIVGQYTKDGSKQKNLELFGTYSYGKESIDDTPMFVGQLYTDENGEEGFGHFYNGGDY